MGFTTLTLVVANPARPAKTIPIEFLIDSGAIYSVVPKTILKKLGIKPIATQTFTLADGTKISRRRGTAHFVYKDHVGGADVLFGEKDDSTLLGVLTLESLGLGLNPLKRELIAIPMMLAANRTAR